MTLKESYINLMKNILNNNNLVENYLENMGEQTSFSFESVKELEKDEIVCKDIDEMKKVFFSTENNKFGHSYGNAVLTPIANEKDLIKSIILKLQTNLETRNAVLTFIPYGENKIPCISTIQFLVRNNTLNIFYTARSQDIFKKFPLDAICIATMGIEVAKTLNLKLGFVKANIISAHIYLADKEQAKKYIDENSNNNLNHPL